MYRIISAFFLITIFVCINQTVVFADFQPYTSSNNAFFNQQTNNNYRTSTNNRYKRFGNNNQYNGYNNYYPTYNNNLSYLPNIDELEKYIFNNNYDYENDIQRLERLELNAFGATQRGDILARYQYVQEYLLSRPKTNPKKSLLKNFGNYFIGQMTGFTPPINNDPYYNSQRSYQNPYPSNYGNYSTSDYRTPFGHGHRTYNTGTGSSSSIRILD